VGGCGVSEWRGTTTDFIVKGNIDLRSMHLEFDKQHTGLYTHTVSYAVRVGIVKYEDAIDLETLLQV
jgi:hypothetical protein